jgi:lipopolysaccharide transport system permease protein
MPASPLAITVVGPSRTWPSLGIRELWEYRELLYFLVWRDVKVRYKQTVLGVAWAVLQPVLTMLVFSVFLGVLVRVPSDGLPYPVFAYAALLPWQLFAHTITECGNSLVANQQLITKVYFPRLVIPMAAVLAGLVDFSVAFTVLIGLMVYYGIPFTAAVLSLPVLLMLTVAVALGVGLWLAALNVQYRDVRYTLPFLTQLWLFATPVAYPTSLVPETWRWLYALNPMVGVVEGFRWALVGAGRAVGGGPLTVSALATILLLAGGVAYFRRMEHTFADLV